MSSSQQVLSEEDLVDTPHGFHRPGRVCLPVKCTCAMSAEHLAKPSSKEPYWGVSLTAHPVILWGSARKRQVK